MTDNLIKYYRFVDPTPPGPPKNTELYAFEYNSFLVSRAHSEFMHWQVRTLEDGIPPESLRGSFTTIQKCKDHIDKFWAQEQKNKEEANKDNNE